MVAAWIFIAVCVAIGYGLCWLLASAPRKLLKQLRSRKGFVPCPRVSPAPKPYTPPPQKTRAERLAEEQQRYKEDLDIVAAMTDPDARYIAKAQAETRHRLNLAELLG